MALKEFCKQKLYYINNEKKITITHLNGSKFHVNRKGTSILSNTFVESSICYALHRCSILQRFDGNRSGSCIINKYKTNTLIESNDVGSLCFIRKRSLNKLREAHLNINSLRIKSDSLVQNTDKIENQLSEDFCNICHWFVDNKLSIHFGEAKAKSILFASKHKRKNIKKLDIKYGDIQIRQHSKVKYLGCLLDETLSREAINWFLIAAQTLMLCNALIQSHLDYACSAWYPNLTTKLKHRIQTSQNKYMRFCLQSDKLKDISHEEFERLNWLPVTYRLKQCVNCIVFKYLSEQCPKYLNEIFDVATESNYQLRGSLQKLKCPFCKTNTGQ